MHRASKMAAAGLALGLAGATGPAGDWASASADSPAKAVAVTQIVEHPALDSCRQGVQDALAAAGWEVGGNLVWRFESAQGSPMLAAQIARTFIGDAPDVIVAISTPSAQPVAAATKTIPVVFSAITNPLAAKLVADLKRPGGNVTGVSDRPPVAAHLGMVRRIVPAARTLGIVYNPGEVNSVSIVEEMTTAAPAYDFAIVEAAAPKSADVLAAARSLTGRADAIYVPTDNTVVSALEAVVKAGIDAKLPVFAADTDSVTRGAIAAVGFNYYDVGVQTGQIVARVLAGEAPGEIPVGFVETLELHLNLAAAAKMGVAVPADLVDQAARVIR